MTTTPQDLKSNQLSNCCSALIYADTDICSACKEHCEEQKEDTIARVNQQFGRAIKRLGEDSSQQPQEEAKDEDLKWGRVCSVCRVAFVGSEVAGTCACLPSHYSWHIACDPHKAKDEPVTRIICSRLGCPCGKGGECETAKRVSEEPPKECTCDDGTNFKVHIGSCPLANPQSVEKIDWEEASSTTRLERNFVRIGKLLERLVNRHRTE